MKYIDSPSHDAYFNMALEEYVFESLPRDESWFMLWQNANAIVVGKYQNTAEEINAEYVKAHDISVVRRLSGGGAMYQDMGNLNFTYVVNQDTQKALDFSVFITPVVAALRQLGVHAEANSRNDIVIDGQKISGNSQYNKKGRTMHHGTLLFHSRLQVVADALRVKADKIESKGIKSVRSRVTNIADHLPQPMDMPAFKALLVETMFRENARLEAYTLTETDIAAINTLRHDKYATWEWNYGRSPAYNQRGRRRFPFGEVEFTMKVDKGIIRGLRLYGDFFGNGELPLLEGRLEGCPLRREDILARLQSFPVEVYVLGLDVEALTNLLLY